MRAKKLYAGVKLREIRNQLRITQKEFATRLGVSLSYLNQMENNHRPVSASVVLALADEFQFDVTELSVGESERLAVDMREALADPLFADLRPPEADLQLAATNAPALARALLTLHRAYRQGSDRLASLDTALDRANPDNAPWPWEEVRDFFHYCDNYVDAVDRAAERFALEAGFHGREKLANGAAWLEEHHGIQTQFADAAPLRHLEDQLLTIAADATPSTQAFQMACQIAHITHGDLIEATLDLAAFQTEEAREIAKVGLANYFAGAALMPYGRFHARAQELRHDLELLAEEFGASLEQVAHRLSTLQRQGLKGIPFFFVRVDQAGQITKRHSATRLQFARYGGACPLWNVHQAFETPGRIIRQLAETPDGAQYICLARDVSKHGIGWRSPTQRYAIALGCETRHASALVYSDGLDMSSAQNFEPIGVSCRICARANCHQRAVPPVEAKLKIDHSQRGRAPYRLE